MRKIYPLSVLCCSLCLVLFLLYGCGAKKPKEGAGVAPQRELTPGEKRVQSWYTLMREERGASEMEQLELVNSFFNRLRFVDDIYLWGKEDYWATPQEMLMKNGGDCEDFATAKYFTLHHLKVPDEKMRLTYVESLNLKKPHMVLSYYRYKDAEPLILDSLIDEILVSSKRPDLIPVYSFNGGGLWLAKKTGSKRLRGPENLSLWQDLQRRFLREAIAAPLPE